MKKRNLLLTAVCVAGCMAVFMTGCAGSHTDEPEITEEYVSGEYAEQLVKDGATVLFGNIDVENEEDKIILKVHEKEYAESTDHERYPNGFYIADKNLTSVFQLTEDARITFLSGGASVPTLMNVEEFIAAQQQDFEKFGINNPDYIKLYDIYVIGDQALLLLARYIP